MLTYAQTQLATPTVGVATSITNVGFTANWTPADANALSFDVKVYDATVTLIKTVNVTGAATALAAISGLTASTAYTFTVTAKGDGTTYTNSLESSPASVSTSEVIAVVANRQTEFAVAVQAQGPEKQVVFTFVFRRAGIVGSVARIRHVLFCQYGVLLIFLAYESHFLPLLI